jgi:hypothetical protein
MINEIRIKNYKSIQKMIINQYWNHAQFMIVMHAEKIRALMQL